MPPSRRTLATCLALALFFLTLASGQEQSPKPIGEIFASDASVTGAVQLAGSGMQVMSGSSVGAGQGIALLRLSRGGSMKICPRTSLSLSSARDALMIGMNSGSVETSYSVPAGSAGDAIITPDFRIVFGPGDVRVAIGADSRGNTCVRPQVDNTASILVSELMSDASYQLRPDEQVMFERGKVANMFHVLADCGCPPPAPVKRAEVLEMPKLADLKPSPPPPSLAIPIEQPPVTAPLPTTTPQDVHVEVDAPFVFSALDPEPSPVERIAELKFSSAPPFALNPRPPKEVAVRPASSVITATTGEQQPKQKRGFFGKIRSFFGSVFH